MAECGFHGTRSHLRRIRLRIPPHAWPFLAATARAASAWVARDGAGPCSRRLLKRAIAVSISPARRRAERKASAASALMFTPLSVSVRLIA